MKRLINFNNFDNITEKKDNNSELNRIEAEINSAIDKYNNNPEEFVKYNTETIKEKLLKSAKDNGYRGKIVIRKSANDKKSINANKKFIVYEPKNTLLQDIGSAAANARRK